MFPSAAYGCEYFHWNSAITNLKYHENQTVLIVDTL